MEITDKMRLDFFNSYIVGYCYSDHSRLSIINCVDNDYESNRILTFSGCNIEEAIDAAIRAMGVKDD